MQNTRPIHWPLFIFLPNTKRGQYIGLAEHQVSSLLGDNNMFNITPKASYWGLTVRIILLIGY